ncbi:MAG: MnmC family methyltransferase, partial [Pseudomonadota bacterium]
QLVSWHREGVIHFRDQFVPSQKAEQPFHVLYYDPFSAKTNPDFWTAEGLSGFLDNWAAEHCVISTYAATGALKRSLGAHKFQLKKRPGYGGKRESFLGLRGDMAMVESTTDRRSKKL